MFLKRCTRVVKPREEFSKNAESFEKRGTASTRSTPDGWLERNLKSMYRREERGDLASRHQTNDRARFVSKLERKLIRRRKRRRSSDLLSRPDTRTSSFVSRCMPSLSSSPPSFPRAKKSLPLRITSRYKSISSRVTNVIGSTQLLTIPRSTALALSNPAYFFLADLRKEHALKFSFFSPSSLSLFSFSSNGFKRVSNISIDETFEREIR